MSAERLSVKRDLPARELGADPFPQGEQRRRAGSDPEPDNTRLSGGREAARMIDLDIECGDAARGDGDRVLHGRESLVCCRPEEGQSDVEQFRLHATERGQIRRAAERRFSDIGGEW